MTPEQFHLENGPKMRARIDALQTEAIRKADAAAEKKMRQMLAKAGIRIAAAAGKFDSCNGLSVGDFLIQIKYGRRETLRTGHEQKEVDRLRRLRKELCKSLTTTGARRFGAWARTKYGRKIDGAQIAKAHGEWLDFISRCEC